METEIRAGAFTVRVHTWRTPEGFVTAQASAWHTRTFGAPWSLGRASAAEVDEAICLAALRAIHARRLGIPQLKGL